MKRLVFILAILFASTAHATTTVTKTIKSSGGDYTSLSAWEAGQQADITSATGNDTIQVAECYNFTDTTFVRIDGWTTSATNYIKIYTPTAQRHNGTASTGYKIRVTDQAALDSREEYVRIDGLILQHDGPMTGDSAPLTLNAHTYDVSNDVRVSNTIVIGANEGTVRETGIRADGATNLNLDIWNTVVYNIGVGDGGGSFYNSAFYFGGSTLNAYNNVLIGGGAYGMVRTAGTVVVKNTYAKGSTAAYTGTMTLTTSASSDATGTSGLQNVAADTTTFTNVTGGSEDYHLPGTGSPLYHVGTDTSGDSAPVDFATDIDGDAYYDTGGVRSIGIDEYIAVASNETGPINMSGVGLSGISIGSN